MPHKHRTAILWTLSGKGKGSNASRARSQGSCVQQDHAGRLPGWRRWPLLSWLALYLPRGSRGRLGRPPSSHKKTDPFHHWAESGQPKDPGLFSERRVLSELESLRASQNWHLLRKRGFSSGRKVSPRLLSVVGTVPENATKASIDLKRSLSSHCCQFLGS